MKIILLSDTHGKHNAIDVPEGDLLIHAGDVSSRGKEDEMRDFLFWFSALPQPHKIFIAGNHDFFAEDYPNEFHRMIPKNCIYLNDSGINVGGINIWGSPVQPVFFDWAFNRKRGEQIRKHWDLIPDDTEILITHGPPYGILDLTERDRSRVGCMDLFITVERIKPRLHVFGHIHEAFGMFEKDGTTFINASNLNLRYEPVNKPVVIEI